MKLIGTELGRYGIFFSAEEVRPLQGVPPQLSTKAIKERYGFEYAPNFSLPWDEVQKDGFKFKLGKFSREGKDALISELGIYNDGIVVSAFTTEDAEAFCKDLIDWGKKTFGFRDFIRTPRQIYASQITVQFAAPVEYLIKSFDEITHLFGNILTKTYNLHVPLELQALAFDYDRLIVPPTYDLVRFIIERRINTKYEEEVFWCQAPLPTSIHLDALEMFEKLISSPKATKK